MTTGPSEPVGAGRYHEQSPRGNPGGLGGRGGSGRKGDQEAALTSNDIAELRRMMSSLAIGVDALRNAVTQSDVHPTERVRSLPEAREANAPQKRPAAPSAALTLAERRVKIATATIGLLVALSGALSVLLASAWSYIKGYGDERVASAVEVEHAKAQVEVQAQRIEDLLKNEKSMKDASIELQRELERARSSRNLLELRAKYLEEVRIALVQKRKIPDKPPELVKAERDEGTGR